MKLRLQVLVFGLIFSCSIGFSQSDSSDLNFYAEQFVANNAEDSALYNNGTLVEFFLEFALVDTVNAKGIWVELVMTDFESNSTSMFFESYTLESLSMFADSSSGHIRLSLGTFHNIYAYQLFFVIEDELGHQNKSISKFLIL